MPLDQVLFSENSREWGLQYSKWNPDAVLKSVDVVEETSWSVEEGRRLAKTVREDDAHPSCPKENHARGIVTGFNIVHGVQPQPRARLGFQAHGEASRHYATTTGRNPRTDRDGGATNYP